MTSGSPAGALTLTVAVIAVAVLLCRHLPGAALALVWMLGFAHLLTGTPVLTIEAAVAVVAFGCARWGSVATVVLSGLSIPAAAAVAAALVLGGYYGVVADIPFFGRIVDGVLRFGDIVLVGVVVLGLLVLVVPWLAGLLVRSLGRTRRSEVSQLAAEEGAARAQHQALQAQEIAQLREDQARLAREVHDVVGHSLAVILAQAESAQYLPDDPARLKETMATIADLGADLAAGRPPGPLHHVAQPPGGSRRAAGAGRGCPGQRAGGGRRGGGPAAAPAAGARGGGAPGAAGDAHQRGQARPARPADPGRAALARRRPRARPADRGPQRAAGDRFRRRRHRPTRPAGMRPAARGESGQGVEGMRRRLDAVGGKLDVRRRDGSFIATAWVPVTRGEVAG